MLPPTDRAGGDGGIGDEVAGYVKREPEDPAAFLFDQSRVRTYELSVTPEDLAAIDAAPSAEMYIPATLALEGQSYAIAVRYKGSVGSFLAPCTGAALPGTRPGPKVGKCGIKLAFDELDPEQRVFGLRKLNLHAMGRDRSLMREQLGYGLFREMGVASPRTAWARVVINGQLEGVFLAVEEIDGRFSRARFSEGGSGNLYKEIWPLYDDPALYRVALESNKGDGTPVDKMVDWKRAIDADPDAATDRLDRAYTLSYLAVDRVILNDDGPLHWYCFPQGNNRSLFSNHNFFWYEATQADRFWLIPWDLDLAFGGEGRVHVEPEWSAESDCMCRVFIGLPQRGASCDPLVHALATWREDYEATVERFLAGPFAASRITEQLAGWSDLLAPYVAEADGVRGAPGPEAWSEAVEDLRDVTRIVREFRGYPYPPAAAGAGSD